MRTDHRMLMRQVSYGEPIMTAQWPDEPEFPEEGDLVTYDHLAAFEQGAITRKPVFAVADTADFDKAVREYMAGTNWYPNVWFISDHGNAHLITITAETIIPGPGEDGYALNDEEEAAWQLANS